MLTVGWANVANRAKIIYFPPEPLRMDQTVPNSPLLRCPAIRDSLHGIYVIRSPFDFTLTRLPDGKTDIEAEPAVRDYFRIEESSKWRHPDKPVVQCFLPYAFFSDTPNTQIRLVSPWLSYHKWPGIVFPGAFDIYEWPARPLNWAFEWHDVGQKVIVKRGDPFYYVEFGERVRLVECEHHDGIKAVMEQLANVSTHVTNTKSLFPLLRRRRPRKLIHSLVQLRD